MAINSFFEDRGQNIEVRRIFNPLLRDFKDGTYELDLVEKGGVTVFYGYGQVKISAGNWVLIKSNASLALKQDDFSHRLSILQLRISSKFFSPEFLSISQCVRLKSLLERCSQGIYSSSKETWVHYHRQVEQLGELKGMNAVMAVFSLYKELSEDTNFFVMSSLTARVKEPSEKDTLITRLDDYMKRHLGEQVKLVQMAALVGLTTSSLCRFYKRHTGTTPFAQLEHLRVVKACSMLDDTDQTVKEIAYACGYSDTKFFTRLFVRLVGQTPIQFRHRKN